MTINSPMKISTSIYSALRSIGLKKNHVQLMLPDWWDDEIEQADDGCYQLASLLSRRFDLDLRDLLQGKATPIDPASRVAFKHRSTTSNKSLEPLSQIARGLAKAITSGVTSLPFSHEQLNSEKIKQVIINASNSKVVDFDCLLSACWKLGIPVAHISVLPVGVPHMDGALLNIESRPNIILSKQSASKAWQSFILAHELGHLFSGHLETADNIIDINLSDNSDYTNDPDEIEATQFALELLGSRDLNDAIQATPPWMGATELALRAIELGESLQVDAGHVALRYAFEFGKWPEAQNALNFLPNQKNAITSLQKALQLNVDFNLLSDDSADLIRKLALG